MSLTVQKVRFALLRACRVLIGSQDYMRQILSQPIASEILAASAAAEAGAVQQPAEGEEGTAGAGSSETSGGSSGPSLLMQILMSAATQPSPIKAVFSRAELEVILSSLQSLLSSGTSAF